MLEGIVKSCHQKSLSFTLPQIPGFKQDEGAKPDPELLVPVISIPLFYLNRDDICGMIWPNLIYSAIISALFCHIAINIFPGCLDLFIHKQFPFKVGESLFCCWPTSISSALIRLWDKQQNQDLKKDQHQSQDLKEDQDLRSSNQDLALKERNNEVTDGTEIKASQHPVTCILDVAQWYPSW